MFPDWTFEEGFAEDDPLWDAEKRESDSMQDERTRKVLDEVFKSDQKTFVSVSSHSGEISSILRGELARHRSVLKRNLRLFLFGVAMREMNEANKCASRRT
jgi:hypothetical protein